MPGEQCRRNNVLNTVCVRRRSVRLRYERYAGTRRKSVRKGPRPMTVFPNPNRVGDNIFSYENKQSA